MTSSPNEHEQPLRYVGIDAVLEVCLAGTRVFQRRDGAWRIIHRHLTYLYDPSTGAARTDLHRV